MSIILKEPFTRNLLHSLYNREINGTKQRKNFVKATYQTLYPNCTIINVESPPRYLLKFTPDGRHLLAIYCDLRILEVYAYQGCSMASNMLKNFKENCIFKNEGGGFVCSEIFERLFKLRHRIKVSPERTKLNKDCCLFSKNSNYAVVGSQRTCSYEDPPQFFEMYTSNDCLTPNQVRSFAHFTIHLVDINCGTVSDCLHFKVDQIDLTYNRGIYLLNDTLAVLSLQHQTIYVYKINHKRFYLLRKIGRFCYDDDNLLVTSVHTDMTNGITYKPFKENTIGGLKHRFMTFLFKRAVWETETDTENKNFLLKFYKKFNELLSFRMGKMQLLDESHILIKYTAYPLSSDTNTQSFIMVYNMDTTEVLEIFDSTSDDLLIVYKNFCDNFRNSIINSQGLMPCSPSNNIYSRELLTEDLQDGNHPLILRSKQSIFDKLPIPAQSFTSSPYLDRSLYSYDAKFMSPFERPKFVPQQHPIEFYSRESGAFIFGLYTSRTNALLSVPVPNQLLNEHQFIFHPTDPFAISVNMQECVESGVNFHIRKVHMPE